MVNRLSREYLREKKGTDDSSMSDMERGGVLSPVDECRADTIRHDQAIVSRSVLSCSPSQVCNTYRHSESYSSLYISTRTSSSPCQHNGDTRKDATGCDHGTRVRDTSMAGRSSIKNGVSRNGHRSAENDEGSTELHVI
jgi:hypothetical protein